ncbi:hypothetical protein BP422_11690 [Brevibacillus formosus]|uniref:Uncharacterized protein n=1 Tax=Brevibacillus formosus TaxID=54913 RepID=A0A220MHR6_9BACL|nr:hypothetical protein [Brevibacillus formosus]ASJ54150.1 hypothetical protein BP422_11690 [Brevibacillus formosus]
MSHLSKALTNSDSERSWLREKVYAPKRQRTVHIVKQTIDSLLASKQRVSLATISNKSKEIDPEGLGISESAILNNEEARSYYELNRTWKGGSRRRRKQEVDHRPTYTISKINPNRDVSRVRQRLMRLSKTELVDRVLTLEQAAGVQEEQWLQLNDELLFWRLRAEQAEARLEKK